MAENNASVTLSVLPDRYAICRLEPHQPIPEWACAGPFCSITRTPDELSIVCLQASVPAGVVVEDGRRVLRVDGKLDFALTGILAGLAAPLAAAGISIFALATFDTDYILVHEKDLRRALDVLQRAGFTVHF